MLSFHNLHSDTGQQLEAYAGCDLQMLIEEVGDGRFESQDDMQRAFIEAEGRGTPCGAPFWDEDHCIYDTSRLGEVNSLIIKNIF